MPDTVFVTFVEIVVHRGLVHHVALTEEVHDLRVLAVETVLELVQLTHGLVVQIALAVALDHGHAELVHRVVGTQLAPHGVALQVIHQAFGGKVGTLVETLHLVAPHLQLHVTVHDGEARLLVLTQLAVFTHHRTEGGKVQVGEYNGNVIELRGLALGETELVLTANGKEKRVPVSVTEGILSVLWKSGNARTLFEGQTVQWGIDAKTLSGGENPYDVTWTSSATDVLTAEQAGDDNTQGTITGIKAGKADVTAEVAGVSSEKAEVKVIALPVDLELNASNTVKENSVVYDEGGDLVVFISPTSGYGQIMLTLTDAAQKELEGFFADREKATVRIYLAPGGCSGPRLALALDEAGENDTRIEQGGFAFCINNELLQQVKSVSIDANYLGFLVTPEEPLPSAGGSSCGGCRSEERRVGKECRSRWSPYH